MECDAYTGMLTIWPPPASINVTNWAFFDVLNIMLHELNAPTRDDCTFKRQRYAAFDIAISLSLNAADFT